MLSNNESAKVGYRIRHLGPRQIYTDNLSASFVQISKLWTRRGKHNNHLHVGGIDQFNTASSIRQSLKIKMACVSKFANLNENVQNANLCKGFLKIGSRVRKNEHFGHDLKRNIETRLNVLHPFFVFITCWILYLLTKKLKNTPEVFEWKFGSLCWG